MIEILQLLTTGCCAAGLFILTRSHGRLFHQIMEFKLREIKYHSQLDKILEKADKFTEKQRKDVVEIKRRLTDQEKKLKKSLDSTSKVLSDVRKSQNDAIRYCDVESKQVVDRVRDIARDFHVLASKLTDGSIKEMRILSLDEYMKKRKLNDK